MDTRHEGQPLRCPDLSDLTETFHILETADEGQRVIAPFGELDLSNAAQLEQRLCGEIATVLDLSGLSFIDSTGIRLLILTARRAEQQGWRFTVRDPQPAVMRVMKLVALDRYLGLDGDIEDPNHEASSGCADRLSA